MEEMEKLFAFPSSEYRGKPFWSWNGKLEKEELLRQIEVFHEMGMGGYFCHSRIGLETEYLGEEWFDLINACADKGESLGMETWLYDEDRWPSGIAGGRVTANPQNRMKFLRMSIYNAWERPDRENIIAAFTVDLDGLSFTGKQRVFQNDGTKDKTVLTFSIEEMALEDSCNGFTYLDTLKKEATECFLQETHEKYKLHCGDKFGKEIQGIFTDEPHRGAVMAGFGNSNRDGEYLVPYTEKLFDEFIAAYGYDLRDFLPELYLWENGQKVHPVKWQYMELVQRLFLENFLSPIHKWCRNNKIRFTGHMLHEDSLTAQTSMIGSIMRAYEYMDVPGVDVLMEHNYCFRIVKQLQSAARQLGKKWMLSELYGATGWQFSFEGHKAVGDWQALFGINLRCHHLSWYSMRGEGKRDYPASIAHQSAWYPYYSCIEDYFARIHVLLSQGKPLCNLLVLNPVESLWCQIYPKWSWQLQVFDPDVQEMEQIYTETFRMLCGEKLDFDYGDEDFLSRMGSVEEKNGVPVLKVGQSVYTSVLVTGMRNMRRSTLNLLAEFAKRGGNVVFGGTPPSYIDALQSEEANTLPAVYTSWEKISEALSAKPMVSITDSEGKTIPEIYVQLRQDGDRTIAVLMNVNRLQAFHDVTVMFNIGGYCEHWDAKTGKRTLLTQGNPIRIHMDFEPTSELCLMIVPQDNGLMPEPTFGEKIREVTGGTKFSYKLHEPNVCLLNFVDYTIDQQETVCGKDILEADKEIRTYFHLPLRGGQMLQPWFAGTKNKPEVCDLRLNFHFYAEKIPDILYLAMETPADFQIEVNGTSDAVEETEKYWVDRCFKLLQMDCSVLRAGENVLTLTCRFRSNLNLEALYLLGDFGVVLNGKDSVLVELPETLSLGDISKQGFPFYGAGISYFLDSPSNGSEKTLLQTEGFDAALLVASDGRQSKTIWSKPYQTDVTDIISKGSVLELQYILTRINTFGNLYRPDSQGGSQYYPLPQGMTSEIKWIQYR